MSIQKKLRKEKAQQLFKLKPGKLEPVDLTNRAFIPNGMTRSFMNNRYVVMIYDNTLTTKGFAIKCLIQKHDNTPIENHWSELQSIKNEIFGDDIMAIEYYPKEIELINDYNIYWLWIYPDGVLPKMIFSN